MQTPSAPNSLTLLAALQSSSLPAAALAGSMLQSGQLTPSLSTVQRYQTGRHGLQARLAASDAKLTKARSDRGHFRYRTLCDSWNGALSWWDCHPQIDLIWDRLWSTDDKGDIDFLFMRRADTGEVISGHEYRKDRVTNHDRMREFYGEEWVPDPPPG
jgi:hypothetical protein